MPDINIFFSSLLERQLHDAAGRASARAAALSRQELHQKARALLDQLTGIDNDSYQDDRSGQPADDAPNVWRARGKQLTLSTAMPQTHSMD
ncbi:hypothetical protein HAT93_01356 [Dickeya solani]|nr:hypothetical protein [Dickeya solani]